jgi:hypothetical protein
MGINLRPVGSELQVNTSPSGSQFWTDVATTTDGRYFVTFATGSSDIDIYGRFINANGTGVGDQIPIAIDGADNAGSTEIDASVAHRPDGGVVVTYVSNDLSGGSDFDIYLRTVSATGVVSHGPTNQAGLEVAGVGVDTHKPLVNPDVATLANGQSLIVWSAVYSDTDRDIHARFLNAAGNGFVTSNYRDVDVTSASVSDFPAVAASGNNALIVYEDSRDGFTVDIRCTFYNGATNLFTSSATLVADHSNRSLVQPDVTALTDGRYVVVWANQASANLEGRFIDAAGNPVGGIFAIANVAGTNDRPRVAALPDGGFVVTWNNNASLFEDGEFFPDLAVLARRFDASGAPAGDLFMVNTNGPGTDQGFPAIAVNQATGRAFIVWEDEQTHPEDGSPLGIRGRAFELSTDPVLGSAIGDVIQAYYLSEQIFGLGGDDTIFAMAGNDIVDGGPGNDRLSGGPGSDSYLFSTAIKPKGSNVDTITDFSSAGETILLDNAIFTKLKTEGALKAKWFNIGKKAHDRNDYIVYNDKNGDILYDKNGDKKGGSILFAKLEGSPDDVSAANFLVV